MAPEPGSLTAAPRDRPLRVGVVGLGDWGLEHVRAWRGLPGVDLVAVCSRDEERGRAICAEYGVPASFQDPAAMARDARLDIVTIANGEEQRLHATLPFLDAGVHALVEKPIALTISDAELLVERADVAGVFLLPGHILRFDARMALLRRAITDGDLGEVRSVFARRLIPRGRHARYSRHHPALMAAIHDFDLARWFFDAEPLSVRALSSHPQHTPAPDILWVVLDFGDGRIAVTENAWVLPDEAGTWLEAETEVIGSKGVASVRFPSDALSLYLPRGHERPDTTAVVYALGQTFGALTDQLSYFAGCVARGTAPERVTARDGVESLRVALGVIDSDRAGAEVRIVR
jgi:predicted dehydrogenase